MNNKRVVNGINTIVLHGKDYVEVSERLRIVYELKKELEIVESQPYQFADRWVWRVIAKVDGRQFIGNAEVKLNAPKGTPDGTNPFECAETSALGRALAFAGLGTVESIASYDEITRGQPFVAVVETPQKHIVDASPVSRLPAPPMHQNAHSVEQASAPNNAPRTHYNGQQTASTVVNERTDVEGIKPRLNALFLLGKTKGIFQDKVGMAQYISMVLEEDKSPTHLFQLTNDELLRIEYALKDAA